MSGCNCMGKAPDCTCGGICGSTCRCCCDFTKGKTPHTCPICSGRGFIGEGFYSTTSRTWVSSTTGTEQCRSCLGAGFVWG